MNFLTAQSRHLCRDILPDMAQILTSRTINYLSFYNSFNGNHQYYSPHLYSHQYLQKHFSKISKEVTNKYSYDHLLAKTLMGINFHENVMDEKGTYRFVSDLYELNVIEKKDIVQSLLKIKCQEIYEGQIIEPKGNLLPAQKRRNIYVSYGRIIPQQQQLTRLITLNPFYQIPNINKIMVFTGNPNNTLHLSKDLQQFCHTHSIKIKLFDNSSKIQTILQFLYRKNKNKILIHENINYQKTIYNLQTPKQEQKIFNKKVINPLNMRLMPQQIIIMTQRLPLQSLATRQNEQQILLKMKHLLGIEQSQSLIDPIKRIAMETIQTNYKYEQKSRFVQSKFGFFMRRFITEQLYKFHRKSQINTIFTNPPQERSSS